jgi:sec-independent protein translocase protein TatA
MPIGVPELLIVLAIVLLIFGPKKLPGLGRSLGGGLRNFKREIRGEEDPPDLGPAKEDDAVNGDVVPENRS